MALKSCFGVGPTGSGVLRAMLRYLSTILCRSAVAVWRCSPAQAIGKSRAARAVPAVIVAVLLASGCGLHPNDPPRNADPSEQRAVAYLRTVAEHISWNDGGNVRSVDAAGASVDDGRLLDALLDLKELEELNLGGTSVSDQDLARLHDLSKLTALSLSWSAVTDESIGKLVGIPHLRLLDIGRTAVGDAAVPHLTRMRQLRWLFVEGTQLTEEGAAALREALPDCHIQL